MCKLSADDDVATAATVVRWCTTVLCPRAAITSCASTTSCTGTVHSTSYVPGNILPQVRLLLETATVTAIFYCCCYCYY